MSAVWVVEVGMSYEGSDVVGVFVDRLDAEKAARITLHGRETYGHADEFDYGDEVYLDAPRERDTTSYSSGSRYAIVRRWKVQ